MQRLGVRSGWDVRVRVRACPKTQGQERMCWATPGVEADVAAANDVTEVVVVTYDVVVVEDETTFTLMTAMASRLGSAYRIVD